MTEAAMNVVNNILDTLSAYLVKGQDPNALVSERMSATTMKMNVEDLAASNVSISGGSFLLPAMDDILGNRTDSDCYVLAKVGCNFDTAISF